MGVSCSKSSLKFTNSEKAHVTAFLAREFELHVGSYVQTTECYRRYIGSSGGMVDVDYDKFVAILKSVKPYSLCYNPRHAVLLDSLPKSHPLSGQEATSTLQEAPSMPLPDLPAQASRGAWDP